MSQIDIQEAAKILDGGGLLLYPTETYFGIGCKVSSDQAIARIFKVKRRLYAMPLPIVLADASQIDQVAHIPDSLQEDVEKLQQEFWPGPLSIIVPARTQISPLLTGGTGKIAMRISPHPVPSQLAQIVGEPIVASSANISGEPPVIAVEELNAELASGVDAVLNWEPRPVGGAPSTLVEPLGNGRIKISRLGAVNAARLQAAGFWQED